MTPAEFERGQQMIRLGRPAEAEQLAKQHLNDDPSSLEAHLLLARAYRDTERLDMALQSADTALALDPEDLSVMLTRGGILQLQNAWQPCIEQCNTILSLVPHLAAAHQIRGYASMQSAGRTVMLDHAKRFDPPGRRNGPMVDAFTDFSKAVELEPHDPSVHVSMASFALRNEWSQQALNSAQEALAIDPNDAQAHLLVGAAHEQLGNVRQASESYTRAGHADRSSSLPLEQLRRLGRPVAGGVGILGYIAIRSGVRGGVKLGGAIGIAIAVAILVGVIYWFVIRPRMGQSKTRVGQFSDDARDLFERDKQQRSRLGDRFKR